MNIEDIKVGETYNVRVQVLKIEDRKHVITNTIDSDGCINSACTTTFLNEELSAFSPITPEPSPKHDPCRKFKEGDIVDYRRRYGRDYETVPDPGDYKLARVISSEDEESGMVCVEFVEAYGGDDAGFAVPWFHLELVTPVEELEPYTVDECGFAPTLYVRKNGKVYMTIPYKEGSSLFQTREEALAAAEAERDRLNAEYRKEQK